MKKVYTWLSDKIWKDGVWSKVIATAIWDYVRAWIIPIISSIGAYIWNSVDKKGFSSFIEYEVSFPLWVGLLAALVIWLIILFVKYRRKKRAVVSRNPVWDTPIGEYTFEELYNQLNKKLRIQTLKMESDRVSAPETVMLTQFIEHYDKFKKGIFGGERLVLRAMGELSMNDGGYITDVLAPKLMEYGLLTETKSDHKVSGQPGTSFSIVTYKISDLGYEFHDCLEAISQKHAPAIYRSE